MQRYGYRLLAGMLLIVCMGAPLAARQAVLVLKDGRRITGEFVREDDKQVVVSIAKQEVAYTRDKVASVKFLETAKERYERERAKLKDNDVDGRFILAYDMLESGELDIAKKEADELVALKPDDARVRALQQAVIAKMKPANDDNDKPEQPAVVEPVGPDKQEKLEGKTLTEDDINMIRVYEIDLSTKPAVTVPNDVVNDFIKDYQDNEFAPKGPAQQREFRRMKGYEKLRVFFNARARPLYSRVQVRQDPPALRKFRMKMIHNNYVVDYCGSVKCHGGDKLVGNLQIFHDTRNRDEYVYTNFYLLDRFETKTAFMINRDSPDRSLLLQYGLPRDTAAMPHPDVKGWRSQMRNDQTPTYKAIKEFIELLYNEPKPDYGIEYGETGEGGEGEAGDGEGGGEAKAPSA